MLEAGVAMGPLLVSLAMVRSQNGFGRRTQRPKERAALLNRLRQMLLWAGIKCCVTLTPGNDFIRHQFY
jgi:hypothetical protein